jgi:hypothetical protein
VRAEVAAACASVQAQLFEELNARTYGSAAAAAGGGIFSGGGARPGSPLARGSGAGEGYKPLGRRSRLGGGGGAGGGGGGDGGGSGSGGAWAGSAPLLSAVAAAPAVAVGAAAGSSMPQFVADALAERDQGAAAARLASLRELVTCLVQVIECVCVCVCECVCVCVRVCAGGSCAVC